MKKIIIPIIIAAVLGVGGGIAAVKMSRPVTATEDPAIPEVKTGKYYLDGDKNSGLWIEVYSDYLTLNGDDVDGAIRDAVIKGYEECEDAAAPPVTEEIIERQCEDTKLLYCGKKLYAVRCVNPQDRFYAIHVSRDNTASTKEELLASDAAFVFNGKDTIELGAFGSFVLVD